MTSLLCTSFRSLPHRGRASSPSIRHLSLDTRPTNDDSLIEKLRVQHDTHRYRLHRRQCVISENLCDDVLRYIGPSIANLKGCDILDVNPGPCLWSSKLHDALRPRTHILMEPDFDQFRPFLEPLLELKDSTYKHSMRPPNDPVSYSKVLDDIIPLPRDADEARVPLIVTGNFMSHNRFSSAIVDNEAQIFPFNQVLARSIVEKIIYGSIGRSHVHPNGPTRMLLWFNEEVKWRLLPRTISTQKFHAVVTQLRSRMTEVAGTDKAHRSNAYRTLGRDQDIDLESSLNVAKRMAASAMVPPSHRQSPAYKFGQTGSPGPIESWKLNGNFDEVTAREGRKRVYSVSDIISWLDTMDENTVIPGRNPSTIKEILKAKDAIWSGKVGVPSGQKISLLKKSNNLEDYTFWDHLKKRKIINDHKVRSALRGKHIRRQLKTVLDLEQSIGNASLTKSATIKDQWKRTKQALESVVSSLNSKERVVVETDLSEYIAFFQQSLMWDQRPYEPLMMHEKEIWPPNPAALIDIQIDEPLCSVEETARCLDLMLALFEASNKDVRTAFGTLHPGAGELVDEVPALRDPSQGGRLDADLKTKNLTPLMLRQIAKAWQEWPWRPERSNSVNYFAQTRAHDTTYVKNRKKRSRGTR